MKQEMFNEWIKEFVIPPGKYGAAININNKYRCVNLFDIQSRVIMGGSKGIHKINKDGYCKQG
jgi:hypothetical protein